MELSGMDRKIVQKRPYYRYAVWAALTASLVAITLLVARDVMTSTASIDAQRLKISSVHEGTFTDSIPITGKVVPIDTIYLDAVEGGKVVQVHVDEGDHVETGASLVTLENTDLQLEVIGREAQLTEQVNNLLATELAIEKNRLSYKQELISIDYRLDLLGLKLERLRTVSSSGGVAREELDNAEVEQQYYLELRESVREAQKIDARSQANQQEQLKNAVSSMTQNLDIARKSLRSLTIKAPISGQLTMLDVNLGESLPKGKRVGQIDEIDRYKVSAFVDEFYLGRLAIGQFARVPIEGREYVLKVSKVYPEVRNRQFEIDLAFQEKPERARLGQTLRMTLEVGTSADGPLLDYGSFYEDTGGTWVYILDPDGRSASRRNVTLGRQNGKQIEVIEGLMPGDRVIVSGYGIYDNAERINIQ